MGLRDIVRSGPEFGFSITPNDSNLLASDCWVYVGGDGNVRVETVGGSDLTFQGLSAGDILSVKVRKVFNTSTTATNLVGVH